MFASMARSSRTMGDLSIVLDADKWNQQRYPQIIDILPCAGVEELLGALSRVHPDRYDVFKCVEGLANSSKPSSLTLDLLELSAVKPGAVNTQCQKTFCCRRWKEERTAGRPRFQEWWSWCVSKVGQGQ